MAASFDCRKAVSADERTVCASPLLSKLDDLLTKAYSRAKTGGEADDARTLARDFLADRAACRAGASCILATYVGTLRQLDDRGGAVALPKDVTAVAIANGGVPETSGLPNTIGACARTTVASVHPRLGDGSNFTDGDFDAGTGIEYANGGYQVSYEREPALIASRPGDDVTMCLVSIPHRCPPDDDRGRFYTVTNARTTATWTLADSQHMCGGA